MVSEMKDIIMNRLKVRDVKCVVDEGKGEAATFDGKRVR